MHRTTDLGTTTTTTHHHMTTTFAVLCLVITVGAALCCPRLQKRTDAHRGQVFGACPSVKERPLVDWHSKGIRSLQFITQLSTPSLLLNSTGSYNKGILIGRLDGLTLERLKKPLPQICEDDHFITSPSHSTASRPAQQQIQERQDPLAVLFKLRQRRPTSTPSPPLTNHQGPWQP